MPSEKRQFGDVGEEFAANFLKQKGYKILERNFLQKWGEIDIIAVKLAGRVGRKKEEIVFVEVKTIKGEGTRQQLALASGNVRYAKQQRLIRAARTYLAQKRISPETGWQIDVVIVVLDPENNMVKIEHLENAVWGK